MGSEMGEFKPLNRSNRGASVTIEGKDTDENEGTIIKSEYGDCEVTILGDRKLPAMVTYPDVGTTYDSCYKGFFQFCGDNCVFKHYCLIHINPPGQHYGSETLKKKLSMQDLTEHLVHILDEVKVTNFHAMGCGMGAYVMLDFASKYPKRMQSMILINPSSQKSWTLDRFYAKCNIFAKSYFKYDKWWKDQFIRRWFHRSTIMGNLDLVDIHEKLFFRLNQKNVKMLSSSFMARKDITKQLSSINCRTILLVSESEGNLNEQEAVHVMDGLKHMKDTTWIKVKNSGVLLTEEAPGALLHPLNLFYAGDMGLLITKDMLDHSRALQQAAHY